MSDTQDFDIRDVSRGINRPMTTLQEVIQLGQQLARVETKLDRVVEDRAKLAEVDNRVTALEMFQARVSTWGSVAGAIWTLVLTLIGAGVFLT